MTDRNVTNPYDIVFPIEDTDHLTDTMRQVQRLSAGKVLGLVTTMADNEDGGTVVGRTLYEDGIATAHVPSKLSSTSVETEGFVLKTIIRADMGPKIPEN